MICTPLIRGSLTFKKNFEEYFVSHKLWFIEHSYVYVWIVWIWCELRQPFKQQSLQPSLLKLSSISTIAPDIKHTIIQTSKTRNFDTELSRIDLLEESSTDKDVRSIAQISRKTARKERRNKENSTQSADFTENRKNINQPAARKSMKTRNKLQYF